MAPLATIRNSDSSCMHGRRRQWATCRSRSQRPTFDRAHDNRERILADRGRGGWKRETGERIADPLSAKATVSTAVIRLAAVKTMLRRYTRRPLFRAPGPPSCRVVSSGINPFCVDPLRGRARCSVRLLFRRGHREIKLLSPKDIEVEVLVECLK